MTALIQADLAKSGLLPAAHLVDAGYVRAPNLVASRQEHGIDLVGPNYKDRRWQAKADEGFALERFEVDWDRQVVFCPQGKCSARWCRTETARRRTLIHVDFSLANCSPCPVRPQCTKAKVGYRSLTLQSREEHEALREARERQETDEFAAEYARRAGVEGTISQGVRAFGLRRARYRGLGKTRLQHTATAAAINIERLDDWLNGIRPVSNRPSRFAALAIAS